MLRLSWLRLTERGDLSALLIGIRRGAIVLILLLSFAYFRFIGQPEALVTIGLVSFAAAAQFAPAIIGGIFWKGGSRQGTLTRSEEHTSELQSLMRISYAVFCLKKKREK